MTSPIVVDEPIHLSDLLTQLVPSNEVPLAIYRIHGRYRAAIGTTTWGEGDTIAVALLALTSMVASNTARNAEALGADQ